MIATARTHPCGTRRRAADSRKNLTVSFRRSWSGRPKEERALATATFVVHRQRCLRGIDDPLVGARKPALSDSRVGGQQEGDGGASGDPPVSHTKSQQSSANETERRVDRDDGKVRARSTETHNTAPSAAHAESATIARRSERARRNSSIPENHSPTDRATPTTTCSKTLVT